MPDFTTDDMASRIRTYIAANDSEVLTTWSQEAATAFYEDAQANGFDAALENAGTTATNVAVTPANPSAASSMLASFYATDSEGGLRDAANADETYMASLYNSEEGTILAPQASGDYYVVTRVGADGTDEARGTSTHDFYDYMASSIAQSDLQKLYANREGWAKMSLKNIANSGIFSADRSVLDYARDIWHAPTVK